MTDPINSCFTENSSAVPQLIVKVLEQLHTQSRDTLPTTVAYIYDLIEQRIVYTTGSVAAMLGYGSEEIQAMEPLGLAKLIHPDDLIEVADHYQHFSTVQYGEVIAVEYRMRRADGMWCWLCSQETAFEAAIDGSPRQILGVIQTLTESSPLPSREAMLFRRSFKQQKLIPRKTVVAKR